MENKQLNLSEPENIMGTMDVNPLLIKLSIPMMVSMLVQALYNVVDSIFVARVSENALTAVSLAFSLQNLMFAVGIGTGVGVNALLSKSLGEKNQYRANKTAENGLFLALCSYLVFLVLGLTVVRPYFYAQTADADIAEQGIRYLTICCVLSLGMFMQVMNEKLLAATSRTTLSMISQLVGAVVNIILDPIFIFGYCGEALSGTTGAALATVIGQFCGAGVSFYLNLRKNPDIQLDFKGFRPSAEAIKRIYVVGLPSIAMQCVGSVMTFLMNQILMAFTATAVAVYAALRRSIDERSDVETTSTAFFRPSGPRSFSMNSRTSRPRSPISANTHTSAEQPLMMLDKSVLLPPPAAAKIPMRCPSPQVSTPSSTRRPREIGLSMILRSMGFGGSA